MLTKVHLELFYNYFAKWANRFGPGQAHRYFGVPMACLLPALSIPVSTMIHSNVLAQTPRIAQTESLEERRQPPNYNDVCLTN